MNQRNRQPSTSPPNRERAASAVRMIPTANVPGALATAGRTPPSTPHEEPTVLRAMQFDDLTEVVDHLRAGRAVLLVLEGIADAAERRRALSFVSGAAYALEITIAHTGTRKDAILLDPRAEDDSSRDRAVGAHDVAPPTRKASAAEVVTPDDTCVLCDLRTADREFEPPLEMVMKRDGSRIWSPPAMVCSHCRATIRHWRFALSWCSECERWGRRNVVSPCGHLYG
jgi:hypothetical protein